MIAAFSNRERIINALVVEVVEVVETRLGWVICMYVFRGV